MCVKGVEHRGAPGVVWGWSSWGEVCIWGWSNGGEVYKCMGWCIGEQLYTDCFCLPEGVHNGTLLVANHVVVPEPGFGVDGFTHSAQDLQCASIIPTQIIHKQIQHSFMTLSKYNHSKHVYLCMYIKCFLLEEKKKEMVLHPPGRMVLVPSQESF